MYTTLRFFTKFTLDNTCNTGIIAMRKNKLPATKKQDLAQDIYDVQTLKETFTILNMQWVFCFC